jgi:hypothetical protein
MYFSIFLSFKEGIIYLKRVFGWIAIIYIPIDYDDVCIQILHTYLHTYIPTMLFFGCQKSNSCVPIMSM